MYVDAYLCVYVAVVAVRFRFPALVMYVYIHHVCMCMHVYACMCMYMQLSLHANSSMRFWLPCECYVRIYTYVSCICRYVCILWTRECGTCIQQYVGVEITVPHLSKIIYVLYIYVCICLKYAYEHVLVNTLPHLFEMIYLYVIYACICFKYAYKHILIHTQGRRSCSRRVAF